MQRFTATYTGGAYIITNQYSEEIGMLKIVNDNEIRFTSLDENYQFKLSKNKVEVLKNGKKVDDFERSKPFMNFKSNISNFKIRGISGWEGGTKLVDENNKILVKLNNKSAWADKGIYEFETFTEVKPYQLALMLHLHIQGSKVKTIVGIALSIVIGAIFFNLLK